MQPKEYCKLLIEILNLSEEIYDEETKRQVRKAIVQDSNRELIITKLTDVALSISLDEIDTNDPLT